MQNSTESLQRMPRPNRSRQLILVLAAACVLVGSTGWSATKSMRQEELDQEMFVAVQYGTTSELAASDRMLAKGIPQPSLFAPKSSINGFPGERTVVRLSLKQLGSRHMLVPPVTCSDPLGKMRVLLENHADPNCIYCGVNPLLQAVEMNHADAAQLLLQHGADLHAQAPSGDTARKAAKRSGSASMLALMDAKTGHCSK